MRASLHQLATTRDRTDRVRAGQRSGRRDSTCRHRSRRCRLSRWSRTSCSKSTAWESIARSPRVVLDPRDAAPCTRSSGTRKRSSPTPGPAAVVCSRRRPRRRPQIARRSQSSAGGEGVARAAGFRAGWWCSRRRARGAAAEQQRSAAVVVVERSPVAAVGADGRQPRRVFALGHPPQSAPPDFPNAYKGAKALTSDRPAGCPAGWRSGRRAGRRWPPRPRPRRCPGPP